MYNNSESAQEDHQRTNQKPTAEENGDVFECKVEGAVTHTHFSFDIFYSLCPHETNTTGLTPALSELKENGNSSWIICVDLKTFFSQKLKHC